MQLQEAVELATSQAPPDGNTVDEIVARGRRVRRRRRAAWTSAGAALTVAAVSAAVALPSWSGGGTEEILAAGSGSGTGSLVAAEPFTFTFEGFQVGRWTVEAPRVVSSSYQIASVYLDGRTTNDKAAPPPTAAPPRTTDPIIYAYLVVYRPGAFDPAKLTNARKLTVDGRPARQSENVVPDSVDLTHRVLAWEYATGAWAVLESRSNSRTDPSDADLRQIVPALRAGTATPAKVPFTVSYVPPGYRLVEVGEQALPGLNGIAAARDGNYGGAVYASPAPPVTGLVEPYGGVAGDPVPGSFEIFVLPAANANQKSGSTAIDCGDGWCSRRTPDGKVAVSVTGDGRLSETEMTKVLQGVTLATVTSDATWPDARTALSAGS
ncbi:hypothetical protein AB0C07_23075 [Actinoplanes missouriensis]|uniref:hypothetical protein n=1 Tax=Actinoplanes missouriensis TaxID=1866 RepID=UPI0033F31159